MSQFTVIFDACVLYPAPLRDLLMHLAPDRPVPRQVDGGNPRGVDGSLLENRPELSREQLERTRQLMDAHVRDCLVADYEDLIPVLTLPDPDDRHVLAAAIRSSADVIVTFNLDDFPAEALKKWGIESQHPDDFINHLLDLAPHLVCTAAKRHRESLKNPPMSVDDFLAALERQGFAQTVAGLRQFADVI